MRTGGTHRLDVVLTADDDLDGVAVGKIDGDFVLFGCHGDSPCLRWLWCLPDPAELPRNGGNGQVSKDNTYKEDGSSQCSGKTAKFW